MGKRQLYTKGETIHKTIQKHRKHTRKQNLQNKKTNMKRINLKKTINETITKTKRHKVNSDETTTRHAVQQPK